MTAADAAVVVIAAADVVTNGEHGTCERNVYAVNIEETNGEHGTCERSISVGNTKGTNGEHETCERSI